eukprot:c41768_g1_i1 orf=2-235(-)
MPLQDESCISGFQHFRFFSNFVAQSVNFISSGDRWQACPLRHLLGGVPIDCTKILESPNHQKENCLPVPSSLLVPAIF